MTPPVATRAVGRRALLAEVAGPIHAADLAEWARGQGLPAEDVVPAATSVLFDGCDPDQVRSLVARWRPGSVPAAQARVEIPVVYDGADLELVAQRWGTDVPGVVARHTSLELVSAFCGFAPGFAYLAGLPTELHVPRLATPRPRVPAGSVAIAGEWCGIYPTASPGGWLLLGRTEVTLWDAGSEPPALLAPGTRVRFRRA